MAHSINSASVVRHLSARRWPLLARSSLKAGLADRGVGRVRLVCWKLQIADHTERIVSRRPVGLGISGHSFTLRYFSGSWATSARRSWSVNPDDILRSINSKKDV